jgi:hypothetical protein
MSESKVFKARNVRELVAFEQVEDFNAGYFNPLIGNSPAETCRNIADVMQLVHSIVDGQKCIAEIRPALALLVQVAWTAAQYEDMVGGCDLAEPAGP